VLWNILHALFGTRFDEQFQDIHFFVRKSSSFLQLWIPWRAGNLFLAATLPRVPDGPPLVFAGAAKLP